MNIQHFDYILVGGGLQSGLIVLALQCYQPKAKVLILERSSRFGGNHTWSFHPKDVSATADHWLKQAVETRWPSYCVRLSQFRKTVQLSYASISSEYFSAAITRSLEGRECGTIRTNTVVTEITEKEVTTSTGERFSGRLVLDCRGPEASKVLPYAKTGYQKFWGFEITLKEDWPFEVPVVMDDCVEQSDGFRFIYTLPFERRRVLVEDTRFSNEPAIDRDECLAQVRKYLASIGVVDWSIQREEHGILPMPISAELLPGTNVRTGESTDAAAIRGGYAGGWFHAATGYSFPLAVAFAETIARATPEEAHMEISKLAIEHRGRSKFGRFLNRLLFRLVKPQARYQIFRRFYRVLSNDAIARFYSHRFTRWDAFRIVVGWPPGGLQPVRFLRSFFPTRSGVSMRSEAISTNSTMKESVL